MSKLKEIIKKHNLIWFILIVAVIKQMLVSQIPIFAISTAGADDRLMVRLADSLLNGKWLGAYDNLTFVKGMFFPFFLALSNKVGISYIGLSTLLYSVACIVFIYAISPIFKKKWPMYFIYAVLMFNPVSFASLTLQRVYRNGVTLSQVLIIIGCIMAMYLRKKERIRNIIGWAVLGGVALATLWNTREDSFWILPFVLVACIITVISIRMIYGTFKNKECLKKILISILPIIMLITSIELVSIVNNYYYGEYLTTELSASSFPDAMKSLYAVVPNKEDADLGDRISIPVSTLEKVYKVSPTMAELKPYFDKELTRWDTSDSHPGDGQVENGWFFWYFREVVNDAGYYKTPQSADEVYKKIHEEIENSFKQALLEKRNTMPSALMAPWKSGDGIKMIETMKKGIEFITKYDEVSTATFESVSDKSNGIRLFEAITNNHAIYPAEKKLQVNGWLVSMNDSLHIKAQVIDANGQVLESVILKGGEDVFENLIKTKNIELENAKNSRFNIGLNDYTLKSGLKLQINDFEGNLIETIALDGSTMDLQNGKVNLFIEKLTDSGDKDLISNYENKYINRCNHIAGFYKGTGVLTAVLGVTCYIFITVAMIRKRDNLLIDTWLLLTAILCSFTVLLAGVSYNEIVSCPSINYMYLSGEYPLLIGFWTIGLCTLIEYLLGKFKNNWN